MLGRLKFEIDPLVNEMLDQIPQDQLINGTVLDPAMGGGQFVKEVERRKRAAGKTDEEIRASVFGIEENVLRRDYAVNKHGLVGTYSVGDFLNQEIEMKFDVIVGNPPYNDSSNGNIPIYQNFVEFAKNNSKSVGMIIPAASAVSDERYGDAVRKAYFTENTKIIKFLPEDTFNADVSTLYFIQDTSYSGKTLIESEFGRYEVNAKTNNYIFKDKMLFGILSKCQVTSATNSWIKFDRREKDAENNKNKVQTVTLINKTDFEVTLTRAVDPSIHQHKVATSFLSNSANHLDVMWYVAPGIAVKKGYTVSIVKSESEGKNLAAYLKSKLCRFIYDATKTSRSLRTPQLKFIPKVVLTKKWSDKALYKHFGLTQEEIDYVEANVK